jgi:phage shock protein A
MEENIRTAEIAVTKAEQAVDRATNAGDRVKIASACAALEEAQRKVAQLYKRWEELEAKIKP